MVALEVKSGDHNVKVMRIHLLVTIKKTNFLSIHPKVIEIFHSEPEYQHQHP